MAQVQQQRPAERPRGLTTRHAPGMQLTRVQQDGVVHMLRKFRDRDPPLNGMVLADVMGLGKSAQAIVLAAELGGRVLVVVPANHVPKWDFEDQTVGVRSDARRCGQKGQRLRSSAMFSRR